MDIPNPFTDLPTLETERLIFRPMRPEDAADVFAYASDPEVARFVTFEPHASIKDSRAFIGHILERYQTGGVAPWAVVKRDESRVIGTCGFCDWRPAHATAEVAYAIGRPYWNQGLTTEAVRAVIAHGFRDLGLNRIEARCLPDNHASVRVMEKAGMRYEGFLREHQLIKGSFRDVKLYAILRRDADKQVR